MNLSDFGPGDNLALRAIIADLIRAEGSISFADFYRLALYHPKHGYYLCCDPTDDYQSSPNVHPVFGAAIARQLADFWLLMDRPPRFEVFEVGAGDGRLALDVLSAMQIESPDLYEATRYVIQDVTYTDARSPAPSRIVVAPRSTSPSPLRARPEPVEGEIGSGSEVAPSPADKVIVATELPGAQSIEGCILSNELLDAMPFERVSVGNGILRQVRVGLEAGRFLDREAPATPEIRSYFKALGLLPGQGCQAEAGLEAVEWTHRAARALRRGYLLTLDYGYEAESLYATWRKRGTLLSFYRHTSGDDPYVRIGRQDLTASVDFTSVTRAGESEGLKTLALTTQADFLGSLGIADALQKAPAPSDLEAFYALRRGVMELIDPSGLGRIRVLVQGRAVPDELPRGLAPVDPPGRLKT